MTRFTRSANGKYVVHNKSYEHLIGTRAQVWHGTAYKTTGGLTKNDILQNKNGRIVSRAKHASAKKENRLVKAGFGTKKGVFGYVQLDKKSKTKSKRGGAGNMPSSGTIGSTMGSGSGMAKVDSIKSMNATKTGGRRRNKSRRGGSGMNALSPSSFSGKSGETSGVDLQFIAGNAA
jgi:hypothetical protein